MADEPAAPQQTEPQTLSGLTVVVTGTLKGFTRDSARDAILSLLRWAGVTSVSRKTDYVVVGENGIEGRQGGGTGVADLGRGRFRPVAGLGPQAEGELAERTGRKSRSRRLGARRARGRDLELLLSCAYDIGIDHAAFELKEYLVEHLRWQKVSM